MDRTLQTEILRKLFSHLAAGTTDLAPEEMYQPVSVYTDTQHAARERDTLVKHMPLVACLSTELPKANDFVTVDLVGTPALIVRQTYGCLKAFANVCRHRGSKVETAACGNRKLFVCPFHAWSYDGEGSLRNMPFPQGFSGMDRAARGLTALPVEERHGMIWVVPTPGAKLDVATHLGKSLDAELTSWGLGGYVFERQQKFDVPVNWKLLVDGFLEDYHLPILHKATIGPYFQPNLHTFRSHGVNGCMVAARANITKLTQKTPDAVDLSLCSAIVSSLFPASVLVWQNDHFELWTFLPDRHDPLRSHVTAWLMAPSAETAREQSRYGTRTGRSSWIPSRRRTGSHRATSRRRSPAAGRRTSFSAATNPPFNTSTSRSRRLSLCADDYAAFVTKTCRWNIRFDRRAQ